MKVLKNLVVSASNSIASILVFCENGLCANENFLVANSWLSSRARVSQNTQIFDASPVSSNRQKLLKYAAFLKHKYSKESNIANQKHDR